MNDAKTKRNRPHKTQRSSWADQVEYIEMADKNKAAEAKPPPEASESSDKPAASKNKRGKRGGKGKKSQFEPNTPGVDENGKVTPKPGEYPVIFQTTTTAEDPVTQENISVDWKTVANNSSSLLNDIKDLNEYERYLLALITTRGVITVDNMENMFVTTAMLTTVQNIINAQKKQNLSIGQMNFALRTQFNHVQPAFIISGQYGPFKDKVLGRHFILGDFENQVKKGIRAAYHYRRLNNTPDGQLFDAHRSLHNAVANSWLPIRANETDVEIKMRQFLQTWANHHALHWVNITERTTFWAHPPYWAVLDQDQQAQVGWMFQARPNNAAEWVVRLNAIPNNFRQIVGMQKPLPDAGDEQRDWNVNDLAFQLDLKAWFGEITDAWHRHAVALEKFFVMTGTAAVSDTGVPSQLGHLTDRNDGLLVFSTPSQTTVTEASLASAYSCECYRARPAMLRDAQLSGQARLAERRIAWLKKYIK